LQDELIPSSWPLGLGIFLTGASSGVILLILQFLLLYARIISYFPAAPTVPLLWCDLTHANSHLRPSSPLARHFPRKQPIEHPHQLSVSPVLRASPPGANGHALQYETSGIHPFTCPSSTLSLVVARREGVLPQTSVLRGLKPRTNGCK
jgi:hypothetical protein